MPDLYIEYIFVHAKSFNWRTSFMMLIDYGIQFLSKHIHTRKIQRMFLVLLKTIIKEALSLIIPPFFINTFSPFMSISCKK